MRVAVGADEPMKLVLDHEQLDACNVDHLMAVRFWILSTENLTATTARCGEMRADTRALLGSEEVAAGARMPVLAAALAARALGLLFGWGLETAAIAGWRLGGVPGGAAHLLLQLGDTRG